MNALLEAQGTDATITRIRELYTEIFKAQLEIIVSATEKTKPEQLKFLLEDQLTESGKAEIYRAIILGISSSDLEIWAKEVVAEKAKIVKTQTELAKQQKKNQGGFFSSLWGSKK